MMRVPVGNKSADRLQTGGREGGRLSSRAWVRVATLVGVAVLGFGAGRAFDEPPRPELKPDQAAQPTDEGLAPYPEDALVLDGSAIEQLAIQSTLRDRVLYHKDMPFFLGSVEISEHGQPLATITNPIVLSDNNVFAQGSNMFAQRSEIEIAHQPFVVAGVVPEGEFDERMPFSYYRLPGFTGTSLDFTFTTYDGQVLDIPDKLSRLLNTPEETDFEDYMAYWPVEFTEPGSLAADDGTQIGQVILPTAA